MRQIRRISPLVAVVLALSAACGDKPKPPAPAAPPAEPFTCFDLRGAVRTGLMVSPDEKTLYYVERVFSRGAPRHDLIALDLATRKTTVLFEDVGTEVAAAGDGRFVFRRPFAVPEPTIGFPERAPEAPPMRLYIAAAGGVPTPLSPEGVRVTSFAVDTKGGVVHYVAIAPGATMLELYKVPLSGGASTAHGAASSVYGVVDGGAAVIVRARGLNGLEIRKLPAAGGAALWTAPDGYNVQVTDTAVLCLQGEGASQRLVSIAIADGTVASVDGAQAKDLPLTAGPRGFVARQVGDTLTTMRFEGGKLSPVVSYQGAALHAAAPLRDGTVAALVTHNSDGDDKLSYLIIDDRDDESDVCLLSPRIAQPIALPYRQAPKGLVAAARVLSTLTKEPDLAGAKLRFVRSGTLLVVEVPDAGPADPAALMRRLEELQKKVTDLSKAPELGLSLRFAKSHRHATSLWSEAIGRFVAKVGVADMVIDDKESAEIEIDPVRPMPLSFRTSRDLRTREIAPTCAGKVTNRTKAPLTIEVECAAYSPYTFAATPWTLARGPTKPAVLEPGATGSYEVKLPFLADDSARAVTRFFAGGKALETFDAAQSRHVEDWLSTLDRIQQKTGILPYVKEPSYIVTLEYEPHRWPAFDEPAGFAELDRKAQEALATTLFDEVEGHFKKQDGRLAPNAYLYGDKGWNYKVEGRRLVKKSE